MESDDTTFRKQTVEANVAFSKILWSKYAVFVGLSFECSIDKGLLAALSYHEDNIPFGEAKIYIVEPNRSNLINNEKNIARCFPGATIMPINIGFEKLLADEMNELSAIFTT